MLKKKLALAAEKIRQRLAAWLLNQPIQQEDRGYTHLEAREHPISHRSSY